MSDDPTERVQMNVRVPRALRDSVDERRAALGLSRDLWVTRVITWALKQPGSPTTATRTAPGKRTVPTPRSKP